MLTHQSTAHRPGAAVYRSLTASAARPRGSRRGTRKLDEGRRYWEPFSDGGCGNRSRRDELLSAEIDAQVEPLETVGAEQHQIARLGEDHGGGSGAFGGVDQ